EDKTKPAAKDEEEDESAVEEGTAPLPEDETTTDSYLVMATEGDNFAISDLESYYFGGEGGGEDEEGGGASSMTSYIYTERPVYRPEQKVYFKGILRKRTDAGYKIPAGKTVSVSVTDEEGASVYEQELPLSTRGTFSGELDLPEESTLGRYAINASVGDEPATGTFDEEESKKR